MHCWVPWTWYCIGGKSGKEHFSANNTLWSEKCSGWVFASSLKSQGHLNGLNSYRYISPEIINSFCQSIPYYFSTLNFFFWLSYYVTYRFFTSQLLKWLPFKINWCCRWAACHLSHHWPQLQKQEFLRLSLCPQPPPKLSFSTLSGKNLKLNARNCSHWKLTSPWSINTLPMCHLKRHSNSSRQLQTAAIPALWT